MERIEWIAVLIILAYIAIGNFVAAITNKIIIDKTYDSESNKELEKFGICIFWPFVVITAILIAAIVIVPECIGGFIADLISKRKK